MLCALCLAVPAAGAEPLRIAYPDFQPFHWRDPQGRMHGFFHAIIQEALERRLGIRTLWAAQPWARCQASVREGVADAILSVPTPERAEYFLASARPFYVKNLSVFTRADHPRLQEIQGLRSLEGVRQAGFAVITYNENGWSKANVEPLGIPVFTANSLQSVWRMLVERRGDLVIEWPPAALPDIQALGLEREIVQTGAVVGSMPFHLLVGKRSPYAGILPAFDQTIQEMRDDGTMDRILKELR